MKSILAAKTGFVSQLWHSFFVSTPRPRVGVFVQNEQWHLDSEALDFLRQAFMKRLDRANQRIAGIVEYDIAPIAMRRAFLGIAILLDDVEYFPKTVVIC